MFPLARLRSILVLQVRPLSDMACCGRGTSIFSLPGITIILGVTYGLLAAFLLDWILLLSIPGFATGCVLMDGGKWIGGEVSGERRGATDAK